MWDFDFLAKRLGYRDAILLHEHLQNEAREYRAVLAKELLRWQTKVIHTTQPKAG